MSSERTRFIVSRRRQRGSSIFVVMAVLLVLTAAGVFAVSTAGLNQRMSGYSRQATQSSYIADMATMAVVDEVSDNASSYMALLQLGGEECRAIKYVTGPEGKHCYKLTKRDVESMISKEVGSARELVDSDGISSPLSPLAADFVVELTDLGKSPRPVAGMNQSGIGPKFKYVQVTFSGMGQVRPISGGLSDESISKMAAARSNRAIVQVGPVGE
ncbi:MAG: hypothetical protein FWD57_00825 [Polyangiaceae bacterium]|nr:hypothetical protein [Polyangiaceae bacterium]